jgi:Ca2+-binding EF-hand superfamily protein
VHEGERLSWREVFAHPIFKGFFVRLAEREEYEETMKGIMTKLRQYFNLNKYSLEEFLNKYGFKDKQEDLSFHRYFDFLRAVYPEITEEEAVYIFRTTDIDSSGSISVEEIIEMLKVYGFE